MRTLCLHLPWQIAGSNPVKELDTDWLANVLDFLKNQIDVMQSMYKLI